MSLKKIFLLVFFGMVVFSLLLNCAGPKEAVKVETPEEKEEVVKAVEPVVEMKPMEWITVVKDAEVFNFYISYARIDINNKSF